MHEIICLFASLICLIGFLMKDTKSIRTINSCSSVLFAIYGIFINSITLIIFNTLLVIIHLIYLYFEEKKNNGN